MTDNDIIPEKMPEFPAGGVDVKPARASRLRDFLRRLARWVISLFAAFVAGVLLIFLFMYLPARQELDQLQRELADTKTSLETFTQNAAGLEDQIGELESENASMQARFAATQLHIEVANAIGAARDVRLSLALLDKDGARLTLQKLDKSLAVIAGLVESENQEIVANMQQSVSEMRADLSTLSGRLTSAPEDIIAAIELLISHLEKLAETLP